MEKTAVNQFMPYTEMAALPPTEYSHLYSTPGIQAFKLILTRFSAGIVPKSSALPKIHSRSLRKHIPPQWKRENPARNCTY